MVVQQFIANYTLAASRYLSAMRCAAYIHLSVCPLPSLDSKHLYLESSPLSSPSALLVVKPQLMSLFGVHLICLQYNHLLYHTCSKASVGCGGRMNSVSAACRYLWISARRGFRASFELAACTRARPSLELGLLPCDDATLPGEVSFITL